MRNFGVTSAMRSHIWGRTNSNLSSTRTVPDLAKKNGRVFWSTNRRRIFVQNNIKHRFEKVQFDSTPLNCKTPVWTEKTGMQSSGQVETRIPSKGHQEMDASKNFAKKNFADPKKTGKIFLSDRPKTPEKFFALPNMAVQDLREVMKCHSRPDRDKNFFYVDHT